MPRRMNPFSSPLIVLLVCTFFVTLSNAGTRRTPIVLDTDIGGDIDDAFALAMVIQNKQLDLKAVTTVTGDTQARARIAAKMLAVTTGGAKSEELKEYRPDWLVEDLTKLKAEEVCS